MTKIENKLNKLVRQVVSTGLKITPETHLYRDLGLASMELMELYVFVENSFFVTLPHVSSIRIETMGELYEMVTDLIEEQAA